MITEPLMVCFWILMGIHSLYRMATADDKPEINHWHIVTLLCIIAGYTIV